MSQDAAALYDEGIALRREGKAAAASARFRRALELRPDQPAYLCELGVALIEEDRMDEAVAALSAAVERAPNDVRARRKYGSALLLSGEIAAALGEYEAAIRLQPSDPRLHFSRCVALLYLGNYAEAWSTYDWRWHTGRKQRPPHREPRWRGESFAQRTLFLYCEQGFGDVMLATRFLPLVKNRGGRVVLQCWPPLTRLFSTLECVDDLVAVDEDPGPFDLQASIMDLPGIFAACPENLPPPVRLRARPEDRDRFGSLMQSAGGDCFKVGIVWSGDPGYSDNRRRAVSLAPFLRLAEIPKVQLYSLQKGTPEIELKAPGPAARVVDLAPELQDFADTAAVVEELDLVIMTDSAVAHLAGSLGKPVWNLVSYLPFWVYGTTGESCPWYSSMRLFRQPKPGDWQGVFERVEDELRQLVSQWTPR